MQSTRLLPPQFLTPSWTPRQLVQLAQLPPPQQQARRYRSNNSHNPAPADSHPPHQHSPPPRSKKAAPTPSLFETLFPEDAYAKKRSERRLDKLPAFKWHVDLPPAGLDIRQNQDRVLEDRGDNASVSSNPLKRLRKMPGFGKDAGMGKVADQKPTVLLLSALTKTLEESDFFRLSPRGEHIEGWTSGIIKVIQARDPHTLSPLSFYFILFTTRRAATLYRDNLTRMHALSKTSSLITRSAIPLSPNSPHHPTQHLKLNPNEDIDTLLRRFSLIPPSGRLSMRILQEPFTPFIHEMVSSGMHAALSAQGQAGRREKEEATVLLVTETGRFSEADILDAIQKDVKRRNLEWRLAGGRRDVERLNESVAIRPGASPGENGEGEEEEVEALLAQEGKAKTLTGQARFRSRFVIAFKDRNEARRFVREWHRMPLPVGIGKRQPPMVDVSMLW